MDADGKLTGSWYFTPDSPKVFYEKAGDDADYSAETNYAQFGYWLTVSETDAVVVNTYATGGVADTNTEITSSGP